MKKLSLILLAAFLMILLGVAPTTAKGFWVQTKDQNDATPHPDNQHWKHKASAKGLLHKSSATSEAWDSNMESTVSWTAAPPGILVPGRTYPIGASLRIEEKRKYKQNVHVDCVLSVHLYTEDGKYAGTPDIQLKTRKKRVEALVDRQQASGTWSEKWVVPGGREGVMLWVFYDSGGPGGSGRTLYFYRWDPDGSGTPPKKVPPLKVSLKADPDVVLLGNKVTLRATVSGGEKPYSFLWLGKHKNNRPVVTVTPKSRGVRNYSVQVTDASDQTASAKARVTILQSAEPLEISLKADKLKTKVGQKVTLTARVKGGTKPYQIAWQDGSSGTTHVFDPKQPGPKTIRATVTDKDKETASASLTIQVARKPQPPKGLKVKLKASGPIEYGPLGPSVPMVLVHRLVTVRAVVSGGSGDYEFQWDGDRGWKGGNNPRMVTYVSRLPGRPNLSVQVIDKKTKQRGSAQLELRVYGVIVKIAGPTSVPLGPPTLGPPAKFTVTCPEYKKWLRDSPLDNKDLYLLLQPHPEARWGCKKPEKEDCQDVNNCMGFEVIKFTGEHKQNAIFCESGTTSVWAEVYAVVGPQKILVGDAYIDVDID